MQYPRISVVIPAYNAASTLPRALDSVIAQTEPAYEVIVVDDGSSEELSRLLPAFSTRVTWIRQSNQGAAAARNNGVAKATGTHVAFLDADDYWESSKLEIQSSVFRAHAAVGLCSSPYMVQQPGQERKAVSRRIGRSPLFDQVLRLDGPDAFDTACCMITSSIVVDRLALGLAPFQPGFEPAEDRELWVRLVTRMPIFFLSQPTTTLVLESGSLSRTNIDRDCGNMLRVVDKFSELLGPKALRWWRARTYRRWAADYLESGNSNAALRPAAKHLALRPLSPQAWWILTKAAIRSRYNRVPQK